MSAIGASLSNDLGETGNNNKQSNLEKETLRLLEHFMGPLDGPRKHRKKCHALF